MGGKAFHQADRQSCGHIPELDGDELTRRHKSLEHAAGPIEVQRVDGGTGASRGQDGSILAARDSNDVSQRTALISRSLKAMWPSP
jgi:hypothetical protein